jgi:tetratricopeptide (TPR) repeat protein
MKSVSHVLLSTLMLSALVLSGCAEVRARKQAREANQLYRDGEYAAAVAKYSSSEALYPDLAVVALNKGIACRQMMVPGAKTAESERAVRCAVEAFERLKRLSPEDARAEQLLIQTLFDADRFADLEARYRAALAANPRDPAAMNGLIQVYSRWDRWDDALKQMIRRAELHSSDAEAQYAVGAFIWSRLFQQGGGADKSAFDPRIEPKQLPPAFSLSDVMGAKRVELADQGIAFLEKALALRPNYREAMTYMNLLYRQKSFAYLERPEDWQKCIDAAESWRKKALEGHEAPKPPAP